jgi:hypothetical protein
MYGILAIRFEARVAAEVGFRGHDNVTVVLQVITNRIIMNND